MKKLLVILSIALLCLSATSCADKHAPPTVPSSTETLQTPRSATPASATLAPEMPADFDFILTYGYSGANVLDTYNGKFTKDLIMNGTATIDFTLPDEAKREIYESLIRCGVHEMPELLTNETRDGKYMMEPSPSYKMFFTYTAGGVTQSVSWPKGRGDTLRELPSQNNNFISFVRGVARYMEKTEEYAAMPQAEGGYY